MLRAAGAVIAMYLLIQLLWVAQTVFLTAFLGVLFGLAVSAGVDRVRARVRLPRGLIAAVIVLGSAGAIVEFFVLSGPVLATQSREPQRRSGHQVAPPSTRSSKTRHLPARPAETSAPPDRNGAAW